MNFTNTLSDEKDKFIDHNNHNNYQINSCIILAPD